MDRQSNEITALYCRIAHYTPGAGELVGKKQMETLSQYAADHHLENPQFYCDWGCSGISSNCPEYGRMLQDMIAGKVSNLVVLNLSRLGRDYTACRELIRTALLQQGVIFHSFQDRDRVTETLNRFAQMQDELLKAYRLGQRGGRR